MEYYQHTTRAQARTSLSIRLEDPGFVRWTAAELNLYLNEALQLWQALTAAYRERAVPIYTSVSTGFYDLQALLPTYLGCTVTDTFLTTLLQYHLLEPPTGSTWTGSDQFTLSQVTQALQRRRDQFLVETGIVHTHATISIPSPGSGRVQLPTNCIDVRRLAWIGVDGSHYPLWRSDEFAANAFSPDWNLSPDTPSTYSVAVTPPVSVQLFPPPVDVGGLECITVDAGAVLNPAVGVLMGVPDDFCQFIKWGALADLLSPDGKAYDPMRLALAQSMYELGVELAKTNPSVLQVRLNDSPLFLDSVFDLDAYSPDWQNTPSAPYSGAMFGRNLLALGPVPDAIYAVSLDIARNIPLPSTDTSYVQVGQEALDVVLGYAQYLALLKNGGEELSASSPLFKDMVRLAGVQNSRLVATTFYKRSLESPSTTHDAEIPRMETHNEPV